MKNTLLRGALILALVFLIHGANAQPGDSDGFAYDRTGYSATMRLGTDLYNTLDAKFRKLVHVQPIFLDTDVTPFARTAVYPEEPDPWNVVFVSAGFVDLMNNVAHARAIDTIEPGYFEKYVTSLAEESGEMSLRELPGLNNPKYWTDDMMDEQLSNFNQMVGTLVAIKMAHHYLGQFKQHKAKLGDDDNPVPINNILTSKEWEAAAKEGVFNALDCGLAVDGIKALFEAIDKMPRRPAWTAYFLPDNTRVAKVKKDFDKFEALYFRGGR
jgi:hypothetical protein